MVPPEVILDRFVRLELSHHKDFSAYLGKLNIDQVESPSFRSFLYLVQETMNEALRLEGVNASGGVDHLPFHFDYLDVGGQIMNARAFPHKGYAFIVVALPMVELIWNLSRLLAESASVLQLLGLESETIDQESLQGLLFQIQLSFVIAHEYTHHIHQHLEDRFGGSRIWTEFPVNGKRGNLKSQAQELDADGYSTYLVLAYLVRGERRQSALELLAEAGMTGMEGDEPLLTIFLLAVLAFLCAFWRGDTVIASIHESTHPPAPIRIKYLFRVAEMWCDRNGSVPPSWFSPERSQAFFRTASEVIDENTRQTWDTQMTFLRSAGVHQYDQQLFDMFEALRRKQKRSEREDLTIRPYV